jgi:hypothetical protein
VAQTTPAQAEGQGTPSLSPTPSPAGSVGSVGSQSSSGYSSGGQHANPATGQSTSVNGQYISVPLHVYNAMMKQNQYSGLLTNGHDLWDQAIKQAKQEENRSTYWEIKRVWMNLVTICNDRFSLYFQAFSSTWIEDWDP